MQRRGKAVQSGWWPVRKEWPCERSTNNAGPGCILSLSLTRPSTRVWLTRSGEHGYKYCWTGGRGSPHIQRSQPILSL
jgi:hypothetical protein